MRATILVLVLAVAGAAAAGQESVPAAPAERHGFRLQLGPLYQLGYEPARELRLALWESSMSRLELAAAREQWAVHDPGPTGMVIPFEGVQLPLRLDMTSPVRSLVLGPWNPAWERLTWQEKVAAGAQTGVLAWALVEALAHVH